VIKNSIVGYNYLDILFFVNFLSEYNTHADIVKDEIDMIKYSIYYSIIDDIPKHNITPV
tara:strand:- start:393 stop:569 length:177 start_codon:yes stop_codon:yes gene_type:complete